MANPGVYPPSRKVQRGWTMPLIASTVTQAHPRYTAVSGQPPLPLRTGGREIHCKHGGVTALFGPLQLVISHRFRLHLRHTTHEARISGQMLHSHTID